MDQPFTSMVAPVVFAEVESTGRHSAVTSMPLHEAVIARMRIEEVGESLIITDRWPEWANASRVVERSLREEYARLQRNYGKELLVAVYGQPHDDRLRKVMLRIHEAFKKGIKPSKIVQLGTPDGDFIEMPAGGIEKAGSPALADQLLGRDADAARKIESSALSDVNASAVVPSGVTALGDDSTPESEPLDGALIEFLTGNGWNEPQATAVARVVSAKGIQSIPDADLTAIPGIRNAESRKALRAHLTEYRAQKAVRA